MDTKQGLLTKLGLDDGFRAIAAEHHDKDLELGRISADHGGFCSVLTERDEVAAVVSGRLKDNEALPTTGDWVLFRRGTESAQSLVVELLQRRTCLTRRAIGRATRQQVVAANIDVVYIVTTVTRDFNERRLERFAVLVWNSGALPIVVLNKADLISHAQEIIEKAQRTVPESPIHLVSALTGEGVEQLSKYLKPHKTGVLIGTSGAGKSTLLNRWLGRARQHTQSVLEDERGRHTTTSRQLVVLKEGGVVIDTPGVREVGVSSFKEGVARTFSDVTSVAGSCRFADCQHDNEPGCAVLQAIEEGSLHPERFASWQRITREQAHLAAREDALATRGRRQHDRRLVRALRQRIKQKGR